MRKAASIPEANRNARPSNPTAPRLHGQRLTLMRMGWVGLLLFSLGSFVFLLPGYFAHLGTLCVGPPCAYGQLTPDALALFQQMGFSLGGYAVVRGILTVSLAVLCFAIAAVILWRKSDDWLALLVVLMLVLLGAATVTGTYSLGYNTTLGAHQFPAPFVNFLARVCFFLVFSLFPSGRFVPRWSFWLVLADALVELSYNFLSGWPLHETLWTDALALLIWISAIGGLTLTQVYRYQRISSPLERQQTKWVVLGVTLFIGGTIVSLIPELFFPALDQPSSFYNAVRTPLLFFLVLLLALSFAIAILRYRLWDIDVLINKALVYGLLSGLLAALYGGLILGLESLGGAMTGTEENQPMVLVISTLAIAALFQPLRKRIQAIIDRRFYRQKYDAAHTLAAFSATLRQEVDLEQIRERVLAVVQETMQPIHVSLWLRQPERRSTDHVHALEPREPRTGREER